MTSMRKSTHIEEAVEAKNALVDDETCKDRTIINKGPPRLARDCFHIELV